MSVEQHSPSLGRAERGFILTIDEYGQEIEVPLDEIDELYEEPYHWGDAMVMEFDKGEDND